ncbi:unnamed protein product [Adineta ricciae]|uniref:Uncharacterized protein n=1 Tax=Adineta ricciae TaxID=249248 RepID=A0A815R0H4_ADIRI|nr:unnamed protein product [Adineta ricciae]CAF1549182.1 unnamed protein product [Adineta ricciae]
MCEQASDTSLSHAHFELITTTVINREPELSDFLWFVVNSMTHSHYHMSNVETTLDREADDGELTNDVECEDSVEGIWDPISDDEGEDENAGKRCANSFSLDYMIKRIKF